MSEWQPIETAKKDGEPFAALSLSRMGELYDSPTHRPFVAWWSEAGEYSSAGWAREVHDGNTARNHVAHPTHWMPLAAAPLPEGAA